MISAIFSIASRQFAGRRQTGTSAHYPSNRHAFTLVEMLVAISITLVMMATVVGVFATVSSSVSNRRAVVEVSGQLRHVRNVLQRDLAGATCPTLPWTRPESNVGYFEIVEGRHADFYPSDLTDEYIGGQMTNIRADLEIDHAVSSLPASNLPFNAINGQEDWVTDGGGLGDYDDILAFTSRNEKEPFTGPAPSRNFDRTNDNEQLPFNEWDSQTISSPIAEVVWYCAENPGGDSGGYFGEAGFRTVYRRTLLVAPWLNYNYDGKRRTGVLRILGTSVAEADVAEALAALIAFQERYDLSARISFDPTIGTNGRWTIVANSLSDLTKRENRYEHHGYDSGTASRNFPFVMVSAGGAGGTNVDIENDQEPGSTADADIDAVRPNDAVIGYRVVSSTGLFGTRPLANTDGGATARVVVDEAGVVVYATTGLVPLSITGPNRGRRGADLMLSDALAFDIQVFDPNAPVYALGPDGTALQIGDTPNANDDLTPVTPADFGWADALATSNPGAVRTGAYVDLGYLALHTQVRTRINGSTPSLAGPATAFAGLPNGRSLLNDNLLTRVYDTWNFGYENDGINQDLALDSAPNLIDEGTNGFDNPGSYADNANVIRLGPDDPGERETSPPYPAPLRAVQVKLRVYEPDSRQMREVTVRQHFVPE